MGSLGKSLARIKRNTGKQIPPYFLSHSISDASLSSLDSRAVTGRW